MLILAVETSSAQVSCALAGPDGVLAAARVHRGPRHAELLTPMIARVCDDAGVPLASLGAVAVGVGPGLFTGLRVGLATARTMAFALGLPMVAVSSLDALAFPARHSGRTVVAVSDARRSEVFWARYHPAVDGPVRLGEPRVGRPAELAAQLGAAGEPCLLVGDGALRYRNELAVEGVVFADAGLAHPEAVAVVQLAAAATSRGELVAPSAVHPVYLRQPDAEANWVQRPGSDPGRSV